LHCLSFFFFFFFQAEDGIRDFHVTGVQTCALPILVGGGMCFTFLKAMGNPIGASLCEDDQLDACRRLLESGAPIRLPSDITVLRSEERRVGKECRSRWTPDQQKKKTEARRTRPSPT